MTEIWKEIPGFPGYEVSDHGRVRSFYERTGFDNEEGPIWDTSDEPQRILSPGTKSHGYKFVLLRKDGKTHNKNIHYLVLLAFVGPRPKGMQVCHYDGNPENNHLSNLRYDTPKGNGRDARRHNRPRDREIINIRELRHRGIPDSTIYNLFPNIGQSRIRKIATGNLFPEIGGPFTNKTIKVSLDEVETIISRYEAGGVTQKQLADEYGIDHSYVSKLVNRQSIRKTSETRPDPNRPGCRWCDGCGKATIFEGEDRC